MHLPVAQTGVVEESAQAPCPFPGRPGSRIPFSPFASQNTSKTWVKAMRPNLARLAVLHPPVHPPGTQIQARKVSRTPASSTSSSLSIAICSFGRHSRLLMHQCKLPPDERSLLSRYHVPRCLCDFLGLCLLSWRSHTGQDKSIASSTLGCLLALSRPLSLRSPGGPPSLCTDFGSPALDNTGCDSQNRDCWKHRFHLLGVLPRQHEAGCFKRILRLW